jgi:peptidoglycan-associated lipoprotein
MKRLLLFQVLTLGLVISIGTTGCKKGTKSPTPIPGARGPISGAGPGELKEPTPGPVIPPEMPPGGADVTKAAPVELAPREGFDWMKPDREAFKTQTVYFDFDSSVVKSSEQSKISSVAEALKAAPANKLRIEGHCDERGTEGYNMALGERRALALREYLMNLGISGNRIQTVSYGESRPVAQGHDESAWRLNRRGEFILLTP